MKFIKEYSGVVALVILAILNIGPLLMPQGFGASGTRLPNGISADITSPVPGELHGDDLSLDDDAVITDDMFVGDLGLFGTSTAQGDLNIVDAPLGLGAAASTTIKVGDSSTTTSRAQFEINQVDGGVSCAFVTAAGTGWVVADGACIQ